MDTNPYEPPKQPDIVPKGNAWKCACLVGLAAMTASLLVLIGTAELRQGTIIYRHALVAAIFAVMFGSGAVAFLGGGIGWLMRRLRTPRRV